MEASRVSAVAGVGGLLLVVAGGLLVWFGANHAHPGATVVGILAAVVGLVGLRVRSWIRRERLLRRMGEDLHVSEE